MGKTTNKKVQEMEITRVPKLALDSYKLTSIQKQILILCSQGYSDNSISKKLGIELTTVRFHLIRIYNKFNIINETNVVRRVLLATKWLKLTGELTKTYKNALEL